MNYEMVVLNSMIIMITKFWLQRIHNQFRLAQEVNHYLLHSVIIAGI